MKLNEEQIKEIVPASGGLRYMATVAYLGAASEQIAEVAYGATPQLAEEMALEESATNAYRNVYVQDLADDLCVVRGPYTRNPNL